MWRAIGNLTGVAGTERAIVKVLIAGAGIAGLTLASLLLRRGHQVRIFEQAREMVEIGAGLQISANSGHVLRELGLEDQLRAASFLPERWVMRTFLSGDTVNEIALGDHHDGLHGHPYCLVHRADLQRMLVGSVLEQDPGALELGVQITGFDETTRGVTLICADGRRIEGDLAIGADGVKSVLRRQIIGPDRPVYSGNSAWRGTIPADRLPVGFSSQTTTSFMGPGRHIIYYWLRGGTLLNFVAPVETDQPSEESWTTKHDWEELKSDFEGWHDDVQTVIDAVDRDACYRWALNIREPVENWRSERAIVIGDAAHPTLPFIAQGAAMAVEDAMVLTRSLELASDVTQALDMFQNARIARTSRMVTGANRMSKMFHHETEDALRQAMIDGADLAKDRDKWLYNYNPVTVPLG